MATEVTASPVRLCATREHHQRLLATDPGYKSRRQSIEQFNLALRISGSLRPGVAHIPVVVHVIFKSAEQNISDAQIDSQITVLNDDFNAANVDINTVPAVFQPLTGNAQIRFFLTTRNPHGDSTTGITRTPTTIATFDKDSPLDDRMKFTAKGGIDAWPSDRYLNIWVCNLGQDLLGYAQFPGGPPETDGVVINHTAFGTMGTATAPFNLGRTTTHELGHYLNCFHIWGDDALRCTGSDQCDDTPNQAGSNRGVPRFPHVSCNNGPHGDLFMNYMDYTDDVACTMFTQGQVSRMDAALSGPRSSLVMSNFQEPILQTGTALHNTDSSFDFATADWNGDGRPDLIAIKKSNTGSNSTEVHILSSTSKFQQFILQTGTALHETDDTFDFAMMDWNGDGHPDLIAIKKSNTGSNSTEVHILSGASKFQQFILQTGTALHETDNTFDFAMTDWNGGGRPDLIAIKKSNTGSNSTEVHILSGASKFQQFILQTGTALHETDNTFDFAMTDWNGDGHPDLIAIKKSNTGSNSTEVHILSGASKFQQFILQTGTALHETDNTFDFAMTDWNGDGRPDLVAIKKSRTGTNSTEVHILAG
uniref:Peptidase M43 pregnancy-associated plasma-A domain-containing protein n=1 Tax=Bionectria ochroleuca TaxID=29856 RepID=A0A8H7NI68_BIOOC